MNATVNYDTAFALKAAGFSPPAPNDEQFWFNLIDGTKMLITSGYLLNRAMLAPTATDILAQFPHATLEKIIGGQWVCRWPITERGFGYDERFGDCPHETTAEGYLAWKKYKGL